MFHSRISVIQGHNRDNTTDHLYDPLRKTFLEDTTAKKTFLDDMSRFSHITHLTSLHNYNENHQLGERTYIDQDRRLFRKHNVINYPDKNRYRIINAQEKYYEPITVEQLERRMGVNRVEEQEIIVYTYGDEEGEQEIIQEKLEHVQEFQGPIRRKSSGIKLTQPKYNLFSIIDEPLNNIMSGKACTCPSNQIIAKDRQQITWDLNDQK